MIYIYVHFQVSSQCNYLVSDHFLLNINQHVLYFSLHISRSEPLLHRIFESVKFVSSRWSVTLLGTLEFLIENVRRESLRKNRLTEKKSCLT